MMNTETTETDSQLHQQAKWEFDRMTDGQVLKCYCESGDEWAFAEFYRRQYEDVFLSCVKWLGNHGMEDGARYVAGRTLETFRRAARKRPVYQSELTRLALDIAKRFINRETAS